MVCPDVNLLLYATFSSYPQHGKAKEWWESVLSGNQTVNLGHVVLLGFLRISTHPRVFEVPLTLEEAIQVAESWLAQPNTRLISPGEGHWDSLKAMLRAGHAGGNLATDAHIAALASEFGLIVYSNDADFARFPGVKVINPM